MEQVSQEEPSAIDFPDASLERQVWASRKFIDTMKRLFFRSAIVELENVMADAQW